MSDNSTSCGTEMRAQVETSVDDELLVDPRSGQVVHVTRFRSNSLGQRLRGLVRFVHTGEKADSPASSSQPWPPPAVIPRLDRPVAGVPSPPRGAR